MSRIKKGSNQKLRQPNYVSEALRMLGDYSRTRGIYETRSEEDIQERSRQQREVLEEHLGTEILNFDEVCRNGDGASFGDRTAFEATEQFAGLLHNMLCKFAENIHSAAPPLERYSPYTATPRMLKAIWRARQLADYLGIPYDFFIQQACLYLYGQSKARLAVPSQLTRPDVVRHVVDMWTDPALRHTRDRVDLEEDADISALSKALKAESEVRDQEADHHD